MGAQLEAQRRETRAALETLAEAEVGHMGFSPSSGTVQMWERGDRGSQAKVQHTGMQIMCSGAPGV